MSSEVRVRIAPSPTGDPHVGTAYIALFNVLYAKKFNGKFILRIEDTDQTRSRPEYELKIFEALRWFGVNWDEGPDVGGPYGPYRQSERTDLYQKWAYWLLEKGRAYKCFATQEELSSMRELKRANPKGGYDRMYRNLSQAEIEKYESEGRSFTIRLKVPLTGECVFEDQIKGRITVPWADIDDQILLKSDGFPTYHLANVVDDHLMKITHVIRGDEWISSTPKHILLYQVFEWEPPVFLHMPLLLGLDGLKLSKRKNPTSILYYRDSGYLQEALFNFLSLMGYSIPDGSEIYNFDHIAESFDPKRIGTSGAVFDIKKLDWLNQQYIIKNLSTDQLLARIKDWGLSDELLGKLIPLAHTRIKNFGEFFELFQFMFINNITYTEDLLTQKRINKEVAAAALQCILWFLEENESWTSESIEKSSHEIASIFNIHHKKVVMPMLFTTFTGKDKGPPLFDSFEILGKDRARARILQAISFLGGISKKKMDTLTKAWKNKDCSTVFN